VKALRLSDGGIAAFSGMNINIDGYARAYHPRNADGGAALHLCVGARVWLPDDGDRVLLITAAAYADELAGRLR